MKKKIVSLILIIAFTFILLTACTPSKSLIYPANEEGYKFIEDISEIEKSEKELLLKCADECIIKYFKENSELDIDSFEFYGWVFVSCRCETNPHDAPCSNHNIDIADDTPDGFIVNHSYNFNTLYYVYKNLHDANDTYLIASTSNLLVKDKKIVLTKTFTSNDGPLSWEYYWEVLKLDTSHTISKNDFKIDITTEIVPKYMLDNYKIDSHLKK